MAVHSSALVRPVGSWLTRLQLPLVFGVAALGAGLAGALPGRVIRTPTSPCWPGRSPSSASPRPWPGLSARRGARASPGARGRSSSTASPSPGSSSSPSCPGTPAPSPRPPAPQPGARAHRRRGRRRSGRCSARRRSRGGPGPRGRAARPAPAGSSARSGPPEGADPRRPPGPPGGRLVAETRTPPPPVLDRPARFDYECERWGVAAGAERPHPWRRRPARSDDAGAPADLRPGRVGGQHDAGAEHVAGGEDEGVRQAQRAVAAAQPRRPGGRSRASGARRARRGRR